MGIEAGWNCHVSLMSSPEPVASANSSVRNLASLAHSQQIDDVTPDRGNNQGSHVAGQGSGQGQVQGQVQGSTNPGLLKARESLGVSSSHLMPRTHSAPSFMNTDEVQVSHGLYVLYEH